MTTLQMIVVLAAMFVSFMIGCGLGTCLTEDE